MEERRIVVPVAQVTNPRRGCDKVFVENPKRSLSVDLYLCNRMGICTGLKFPDMRYQTHVVGAIKSTALWRASKDSEGIPTFDSRRGY